MLLILTSHLRMNAPKLSSWDTWEDHGDLTFWSLHTCTLVGQFAGECAR